MEHTSRSNDTFPSVEDLIEIREALHMLEDDPFGLVEKEVDQRTLTTTIYEKSKCNDPNASLSVDDVIKVSRSLGLDTEATQVENIFTNSFEDGEIDFPRFVSALGTIFTHPLENAEFVKLIANFKCNPKGFVVLEEMKKGLIEIAEDEQTNIEVDEIEELCKMVKTGALRSELPAMNGPKSQKIPEEKLQMD